jgi:hypothetical protein
MEQTTINRETFREALVAAIEQRGADFVYPEDWKVDVGYGKTGCVYYKKDVGAACIIGKALENLGVDVEKLQDGGTANWWSAGMALAHVGVRDNPLMEAATIAQSRQDKGKPWGEALDAFDRELARQIKAEESND